jgi:hypothetical protein
MTRPTPDQLRFSIATRQGWGGCQTSLQIALVAWIKMPSAGDWARVSECKWVVQMDPTCPTPHMGLAPRFAAVSIRSLLGHLLLPYEVIAKSQDDANAFLSVVAAHEDDPDPNAEAPQWALRWCLLRDVMRPFSYDGCDPLHDKSQSVLEVARLAHSLWEIHTSEHQAQQEPTP